MGIERGGGGLPEAWWTFQDSRECSQSTYQTGMRGGDERVCKRVCISKRVCINERGMKGCVERVCKWVGDRVCIGCITIRHTNVRLF